ncbi:NADH-quinone oxidoreductase subunit L [Rheinheimera metallidurans]|uniref:NADH-quinone oxidoreductase subunit L n=1 Tax=Rheinheimera metallidurans TaxID=2925781 RepID=UPI003001465D
MQTLFSVNSFKLVLLALIALLALVIWRYSSVALTGEPDKPRFMRSLAFTLSAVVFTLISNHLLLFWLGWLAISLALHQLLLFYPERPRAQLAAQKKALSARLSEVLLAIAFTLLYLHFGTANISTINTMLASAPSSLILHSAAILMVLVALLKCAQLPLHGWLIQVVEAPTPVSALLHAGIINLGGILLLLFLPLLRCSPIASFILLVTALGSTIVAALVVSTRISIKVRLAWSTVAQMGLMLVEIALGLYTLALLHLLAHSCYKAYAFLHSGNAVNHYLAAQLAEQAHPRARHWLVSLLLAVALVSLTQQVLPLSSLSSAVLLILAITVLLVPTLQLADNRRPARVLLALVYAIGLLILYFSLKTLLQPVMPTPHSVTLAADMLSSVAFVGLFMLTLLLRYQSHRKSINKVFIWLNAGGYLDEWTTRITLKIWPYTAHTKACHKVPALQEAK